MWHRHERYIRPIREVLKEMMDDGMGNRAIKIKMRKLYPHQLMNGVDIKKLKKGMQCNVKQY